MLIPSMNVFAASGTSISVGTAIGKPGDQVSVNISLSGNPGIAYLKLKIGYDATQLTLKEVQNAGVLSGTFTTSKTTDTNPYVLQWMGAENSSGNGVVATLTFQIVSSASAGDKSISVSVDECYNENFDDVTLSTSNGKVTVNTTSPKVLSSISVSQQPNKTTYFVGESLDTTGLQLKLTYSDGSTAYVTSGFTTSGFSSSSAGTKTVTVNYGGKTTSFIVTVQNSSIDYDGQCGDNAYYTIDQQTNTLTISGTGYMWHYEHKEVPWVSYKTDIKKIVIENGIYSIGTSAFGGFTNLTTIQFPNSITDINSSAFVSCTSLERIVIPEGVNYLGQYVFDNCQKLRSIQISSTVNSISEQAFGDLVSLEEIIVSAQNKTYYAENGVLYGNGKLYKYPSASSAEHFIIPNGIDSVCWRSFSYSKNLKSIDLSTVTSIKSTAFEGCESLQEIDLTNCNTIEGYAFSGCIGLKHISLPNSISSIEMYTFSGCSSLTEISIPNSVKKIGRVAFYGCNNLKDLTLPASVTSIEDMAFRCSNLRNVTILSNNVDFGDNVFGYVSNGRFVGSKDLTLISYKDSDTEQYAKDNFIPFLEINSKKLISISVSSLPKSTYFVGESLETNGMKIKLTYSDGSSEIVSDGFTTSGFSSTSAGTKTVTVSYGGKSTTFTVTVQTKPSTAIISANNVSANSGDQVSVNVSVSGNLGIAYLKLKIGYDATQLTLKEAQNTGVLSGTFTTSKTTDINPYVLQWMGAENSSGNGVVATLTFQIASNASAGDKAISVSVDECYNEKFDDVTLSSSNGKVTVNTTSPKVLTSISVNQQPTKTTYFVGESLDTTGLQLKVNYDDGSTSYVTSGFTTSGFSSTSAGTKTVTVSYGGKTTTFTVTIINKSLTSISINQHPTKTTYFVGEALDTTGLQLKLNYDDGSTSYVTSGFTTSGFSSSSAGTKTVTVSYGGKTTTFSVTVKNKSLTSISVSNQPTKTSYFIGEALDTTGLQLKLNYDDGSTEYVTGGFTTSGFSSTTAGTKTVTVSYSGKTTSFIVIVNYKSIEETKTDISKWKVSGVKNLTYTGKVLKQSNIIVSNNGEYADFTVKYKNNLNVGTATVTITGTGDYTGTIVKTFKITKATNPVKVTAKKTVTAKTKKNTTIKKAIIVKNAQGKVTYTTNNKKVIVKNGTITIAKGFKKGKIIKVNVTIISKGNSNYKSKKIVKTIKIIVK